MRSRTLVMETPGTLEVREFDVPDVGPGEVLIEVELCGVCGTDVHMNEGGMPLSFPVVPGHEFAGRVVETGEDVDTDFAGNDVSEGDAVTVCPGRACGDCWYCNNVPSRPTACTNRTVYGFVGTDEGPPLRGGMSEYVLIESDADFFRIPDELGIEYGALVEPLAVASYALQQSFPPGQPGAREGYGPGQSVAVQGAGPIGLLTVATARATGADEIVAVDMIDERLEMAERFGATDVVDVGELDGDDEVVRAVRDAANGGVGPDVVVEAVGHPSAFEQGLRMPRNAGTLVELGHFADAGTAEINPTDIVQNDVSIASSYVYPPAQFQTSLSLLRNHRDDLPFLELFNHRADLSNAEEAFEKQAAGESYRATIHP
jgi:L-iditol 2-dehydrogenase